ncbi:MAG: MBL fold metallo-hydrolase, partial [Deltaproteobacteria bacterium]|nr:MBL fold metallo-hydrolase [Deltaproteobacteria bacterium]
LQGLRVLVIDGLRFRNHPTHFSVSQAIDIAQKLKAERVILTHLSHDVDYCLHQQSLPKGVEFAYDGLTISLNDGKNL